MGRFDDALRRTRARRDRRDQAPLAVRRRPAAGCRPRPDRPRLRRVPAPPRSPCLVDERFAGTWDDLRAARAATDAPLLAKGFFSTAGDLRTAKEAGADAVLLLLRDLDDDRDDGAAGRGRAARPRHARRGARRAELARAVALDAPVVGVNARDLSTFAIDRARAARAASRAIPRRPRS